MTSVNEMKELQAQLIYLAREVAETQRVLLDLVETEFEKTETLGGKVDYQGPLYARHPDLVREKQDREIHSLAEPYEISPGRWQEPLPFEFDFRHKDLDKFAEDEIIWTEIEHGKILGHLKDGTITILGEVPAPPVEEELDLYDEIVRATLEDLV